MQKTLESCVIRLLQLLRNDNNIRDNQRNNQHINNNSYININIIIINNNANTNTNKL